MDNHKTIRKQIRFTPDTSSYALIDINPSNDSFNAQYAGLVIDESHGGYCLIVLSKSAIKIMVEAQFMSMIKGRVSNDSAFFISVVCIYLICMTGF